MIHPLRPRAAAPQASLYGVEHRIEFVVGNFVDLAPQLRADVCFLSPPWGGPENGQVREFQLASLGEWWGGVDGFQLLRVSASVAPMIGCYLPIECSHRDLAELSAQHPTRFCEVLKLHWGRGKQGKRARAILACFQDDAERVGRGLDHQAAPEPGRVTYSDRLC